MTARRAEVAMENSPLTRAFLDAHPDMWPSVDSFVPSGWDEEIAQALRALVDLSIEAGVAIRVAQIKSKLAGLRIYLDIDEESAGPLEIVGSTPISTRLQTSSSPGSLRERATSIVRAAERRCATRCELCGAPGEFRNEAGWFRIACVAHAQVG